MALGHRQDIAQATAGQLGTQAWGPGRMLASGHPPGRGPGIQRAADHLLGQRGLGGERGAFGNPGGMGPGRVGRPGPGQVLGPVDKRAPGRGSRGEVDRDLGVLSPPGGAGVLPLSTAVAVPFLMSPVSSTYAELGIS
jgi:hypothetical protein